MFVKPFLREIRKGLLFLSGLKYMHLGHARMHHGSGCIAFIPDCCIIHAVIAGTKENDRKEGRT